MPLRHLTRSLAAAGTLLLAARAAPAFAQTADIAVTFELNGDIDKSDPAAPKPAVSTAGFTIGAAEKYTVTVTNKSALIVTGFTLDATMDAALKSVSVTDCKPTGTGATPPTFPCTWSGPPLEAGQSATLSIAATYPAPKPLGADTAACPGGTVDVTSSVAVSKPTQGATPLTDPDPANDAASFTSKLRNWADLEVASVDGPGNVNQGQTVTYTTVVTNIGPCDAPKVRVSLSPDGSLAFAGNVSSNCTGGAAAVTDFSRCDLGTLTKGQSQTVTADYTVATFPSDLFKGAVSFGASIASRDTSSGTPPVVTAPKADEPNADNNSSSTTATVDLSSHDSGCSTGGAGGILAGLLALAGLRLRRRAA